MNKEHQLLDIVHQKHCRGGSVKSRDRDPYLERRGGYGEDIFLLFIEVGSDVGIVDENIDTWERPVAITYTLQP